MLTSALTSDPYFSQLWQLFAGAKKRQVPGHYQALLLLLADGGGSGDGVGGLLEPAKMDPQSPYKISQKDDNVMEKWTAQIEKVRGSSIFRRSDCCRASAPVDMSLWHAVDTRYRHGIHA